MGPTVKLCNGVDMPLLSLGTWRLIGSKLQTAIETAWNVQTYGGIDSAAVYGNEGQIRQCIDKLAKSENDKVNYRPKFFLTSKLQPKDAKGFDESYQASIKSISNLGGDSLDLFLIHWPGIEGKSANSAESRKIRLSNWQALERLYKEKKVRAIGVSNFTVCHLKSLMEDGAEIHPMVNQIEFHPLCYSNEMLDYARENKIHLTAYSSLGSRKPLLLQNPIVNEISRQLGVNPAVVLLAWSLNLGLSVLPCSTNPEHIRENAESLNVKLSAVQMRKLCNIGENYRFCWNPTSIL